MYNNGTIQQTTLTEIFQFFSLLPHKYWKSHVKYVMAAPFHNFSKTFTDYPTIRHYVH
jgi:hypothetical protein